MEERHQTRDNGPGTKSATSVIKSQIGLEGELQAKLNGASSTRTDYGVGSRNVGCRASATKKPSPTRRIVVCVSILTTERIREIRMVEEIEEFCSELCCQPFPELPVLGDREIYVAKSSVTEYVAAHCAESAEGRWNHEGLSIGVTTETSERCLRRNINVPAVHGSSLVVACGIGGGVGWIVAS